MSIASTLRESSPSSFLHPYKTAWIILRLELYILDVLMRSSNKVSMVKPSVLREYDVVTKSTSNKRKTVNASRIIPTIVVLAFMAVMVISNTSRERSMEDFILQSFTSRSKKMYRKLSVDLGNGQCEWTQAVHLPKDSDPYYTLIASYPGSGMRFTWQQTEGLTGITVGDEFNFNGDANASIMKSHYPHPEGTWNVDHRLDQIALLVRNPRWAMVSYHDIIWELEYSYDRNKSLKNIKETFTRRPPVDEWRQWRDLYFDEEINLWVKHINFWMGNGSKYWEDYDYERNGQYPFHYYNDSVAAEAKDPNCASINCFPQTIIVYELLRQLPTGPEELGKLAEILRNKRDMTVVGKDAVPCVWNKTLANVNNTDEKGRPGNRNLYRFTMPQMQTIIDTIHDLKVKYSEGNWDSDPRAQELLQALTIYWNENTLEYDEMEQNPPKPENHTEAYREHLIKKFESTGRLNRYRKDKVENMNSIWDQVRNRYPPQNHEPVE